MSIQEAENFKNQGNEYFKTKDYDKSIESYTKAIQLNPSSAVYYSNRSAAYAAASKYTESLEDAQKSIELDPKFVKGYSRLGAAQEYLGNYDEAEQAYDDGLKVEPHNSLLLEAKRKLTDNKRNFDNHAQTNFMDLFNDPMIRHKMSMYKDNPTAMMSDPDIMKFFSKSFGAPDGNKNASNKPTSTDKCKTNCNENDCHSSKNNFDSFNGSHNSQSSSNGIHTKTAEQKDSGYQTKSSSSQTSNQNNTFSAEEKEAEIFKESGNKYYKARDFENALIEYNKAKEKNPNTIIYDLNIAAVLFETQKYQECIDLCLNSIERGRELRASNVSLAKAFSRIASSYVKLNLEKEAIKYFNLSLAEQRNPEVLKKLKEIEKTIQERAAREYENPTIAESENGLGNEHFKNGNFYEALKHYSEAIKRNPKEPKYYCNRAAAFSKTMEYGQCVIDCDKALAIDPKFIKAYLRKGNALINMLDFIQAKNSYEKALEIDSTNREAIQGLNKCSDEIRQMNPEEAAQRAMRDPEIQQIMSDPEIRTALEAMQSGGSSAAQKYMSDPIISTKIMKLINAGILKVGSQ